MMETRNANDLLMGPESDARPTCANPAGASGTARAHRVRRPVSGFEFRMFGLFWILNFGFQLSDFSR